MPSASPHVYLNYEGADAGMVWGIVDREIPQILVAICDLLAAEPD